MQNEQKNYTLGADCGQRDAYINARHHKMFLLSNDLKDYGTKTKALRDIVTLTALLSHGNTGGKIVFPSQACVRHEIHCSPKTLIESLAALEQNGFIRRYIKQDVFGEAVEPPDKRKVAQPYIPCRLHKRDDQLHLPCFLVSGGLFAYLGEGARKHFMRLLVFHAKHIGMVIPGGQSLLDKTDEVRRRLEGTTYEKESSYELRFVPESALVGLSDKVSLQRRLQKIGVVVPSRKMLGDGVINGLVLLLNPHPDNIKDGFFWEWLPVWHKEWEEYLVQLDLDKQRRKTACMRDAEELGEELERAG